MNEIYWSAFCLLPTEYTLFSWLLTMNLDFPASKPAATVAQSVKTFALQAEGWVFVSLPRQSYVVITGIRKAAPLEIKIYWSRFKLTELVKTEDFEHFLLKIHPPQEYSLVNLVFCLNMSVAFLVYIVWFALYYSKYLIYYHYNWLFCYKLIWPKSSKKLTSDIP